MKKIKTIYRYLNEYPKNQIDEIIKQLSKEDQKLLKIRYGNDLNDPIKTELTNAQKN